MLSATFVKCSETEWKKYTNEKALSPINSSNCMRGLSYIITFLLFFLFTVSNAPEEGFKGKCMFQ